MSNDSVSIIIVTFNGKSHLEKCLDSLSKINYQNFEIIIVDNHSTDGSVEFVKSQYSKIKLIQLDKNYGFAEPNNIAAKEAAGKYLMFLNNDTVVTPDFVRELVKIMSKDTKIAIAQSILLRPNGDVDSSGDYVDTLGRTYSAKDRPNDIRPILSARGAAMMVRKDVFWQLEGFDKNFFATFEDVDIGWRSWISGYKVVLIPKSIVYHIGGQTITEINSLIQFHGVKNSLVLRLTNFEISHSIKSIVLIFFVIFMRKFFHITVIKDPEYNHALPSFGIITRGIIWVLKNLKYVIAKRRKVNSKRISSTADLIKNRIITKYSF